MSIARTACSLALVLGAGCFTADFDPDQAGAFFCEADADCEDEDVCVNARCEADLQTVEIRNPEDEATFQIADATAEMPRGIDVTIAGSLDLVAPTAGAAHVYGEGHLVMFVDGVMVDPVTEGPFSAGFTVPIQVLNHAGPHRVSIQARRNDGVDYDNPEARFTRLFWIDDGTPQVALKSPWPNTRFGLDSQSMAYSVASLRVELVAPQAEGMIDPAFGHTHIYYDETFPGCIDDSQCDPNYIAIGDMAGVELMATIPESAETNATLTAVLRNIDHTPYRFGPVGEERFIFDTIAIVRED